MKISNITRVGNSKVGLKAYKAPIQKTHCAFNGFDNQPQVIQFGVNGKQRDFDSFSLPRIEKDYINLYHNLLPSKTFII